MGTPELHGQRNRSLALVAHQDPRGCSVEAPRVCGHTNPGSTRLSRNARTLKRALLGRSTPPPPLRGRAELLNKTTRKISVLRSTTERRNWKTPVSTEASSIQRNEWAWAVGSESPGKRGIFISNNATINASEVAIPRLGPSLRALQPPSFAVTIATATTAQKGTRLR